MVAPALRKPCAEQFGRPASSHQSRNRFPKPASVNGRFKLFIRKVRSPQGEASMIRCRTGRIGKVSCFGFLFRPLCYVYVSFVADVLLSEPDHVRSPLTREEQEGQSKPSLRSNWVMLLKFLNFLRGPGVESSRSIFELLNVAGGVV